MSVINITSMKLFFSQFSQKESGDGINDKEMRKTKVSPFQSAKFGVWRILIPMLNPLLP
jgi:hypothetical protein